MGSSNFTRRCFWLAEILLLAGTTAAAAYLSSPAEWRPLSLVALLLAIALGGEWFTIETRGGILSASLGVMALAMGLLGPGPAGACGVAAIGLHSALERRGPALWLNNLVAFGVAGFAGGLVVRAVAGNVAGAHSQQLEHSILFALTLLVAVVVLLVVNFILFASELRTAQGRSLTRLTRELFLPLLPGELAVAVIAIILVLAYRSAGLPVLLASVPVLLIFRQLAVALERSERRAEQLMARTRQLSSFQWGVPSMFMEGLGLRDPTSLRHAATVASYAKAMAVELGCSESEQEVIHLVGLLHDIGKFAWSDRLLHPEQLTDEDWKVIRRHPQDGAAMVGKLDGFGPVADAILYHHERVDGGGYPAGLIGKEIPLASRIVAIGTTYDRMTERETFGPPMSPEEAMAELRNVAGRQLDAELVEVFIALLERHGPAFAEEADYKTELAFEARVRKMAEPTSSTPVAPRRRRLSGRHSAPPSRGAGGSDRERALEKG
jgi:putative nucleotidyltransferase with HDIG domain